MPLNLFRPGSVKINAGMQNIQTREEYEKEKEAFLTWIEDFGDYEKVVLKQFITSEKPGIKSTCLREFIM